MGGCGALVPFTPVGDREVQQSAGIVRLQPRRSVAHHVQKEIMHPRLVQDDVRELGQAVFDVLHPAATDDICAFSDVRLPERRLVNPIGFFHHPLAETERLEHLHRAAGNAVGLAKQQRTGFLLDDPGLDVGKRRKLCGQRKPRRSAADDQDIDFVGESVRRLSPPLGGLRQFRIAGLEPVEMELHGLSRFPRRNSSPSARLANWRLSLNRILGCLGAQGATCNQLSPQDDGGNLWSAAAVVETSGPSPLRGLFLPKIPGPV